MRHLNSWDFEGSKDTPARSQVEMMMHEANVVQGYLNPKSMQNNGLLVYM